MTEPSLFYFILELSVPFVAACDLPEIARINKTCRTIALASFQTRLDTPLKTYGDDNRDDGTNTDGTPKKSQPISSYNVTDVLAPWKTPKGHKFRNPCQGQLRRSTLWRNHWKKRLYVPEHLDQSSCRMEGCYEGCFNVDSGAGRIIMVICKKWNTVGGNNNREDNAVDGLHWMGERNDWQRENEGADILFQLWGVVYDRVNVDIDLCNSDEDTDQLIHPSIVQPLTEPCGKEERGLFGTVFGKTEFSQNGHVLAVVTSLPNRHYAEQLDLPTIIKIFDVTSDKIIERQESYPVYRAVWANSHMFSELHWSLSKGGELLSVVTQQWDVGGYCSWKLYDLRKETNEKLLFSIQDIARSHEDIAINFMLMHYFTTDNDFVMFLHRKSQVEFLKSQNLPQFANRLILVSLNDDCHN